MKRKRRLFSLLPWLFTAAPVAGDTVHLTDGTVIEGRVLDLGDEVLIQRSLGAVTVSKREVVRITFAPTLESRYEERAAALVWDDVKGHLALAAWCRNEGLSAQARAELEKALEADPDHAAARSALGHEKIDGRWMTFEEAQTARGLVLHRGKWMTPEARDVRAALERAEGLRRSAREEVRRLLRRAGSSRPEERDAARRRLAEFPAEDRRRPCLEALSDADPDVRAAAASELETAGGGAAVAPLARRCVLDESKSVRDAAGAALMGLNDSATGAAFLTLFQNGNDTARRRAAEGLAAFPERKAVPFLAAALEEALKEPEGISLTVGGPGSASPPGPLVIPGGTPVTPPGGLPTPRALVVPRVLTAIPAPVDPAAKAAREALRDAAVRALRSCSGGQDFGEDVGKWKGWWVREGMPR